MRIAYIAPYQGKTLRRRRPIVRNLSLGGTAKIELFAELLQSRSHSVEIVSQGEVIERSVTYYPGFIESEAFSDQIPIHYSSALPVRFLNGIWSSHSTLSLFKARHRALPFDLVLIYNLKVPQVACANYALRHGLPVVLQYEDDHFLGMSEAGGSKLTAPYQLVAARRVLESLSGCVANAPLLLSQTPAGIPKLLLSGVIGGAICSASRDLNRPRRNWVVFSGTHTKAQGLEQLIAAWKIVSPPGWQLHIAGHGDLTVALQQLAAGDPSIVFHGILNRLDNAHLISQGRLSVVPFDVRETQGFSFKTVECLGAGLHVITTRLSAMAGMASELAAGISYIDDNHPETIAAALRTVIETRGYEVTVQEAALQKYGEKAVSHALDALVTEVVSRTLRHSS